MSGIVTDWWTFSGQSKIINILDFVGHTASVATIQFCFSTKATTDKWEWLLSNIIYWQKSTGRFDLVVPVVVYWSHT